MQDDKIKFRKIENLPVDGRSVSGEEPQLRWIDIDNLVIDPRYQRSLELRGANNIEKIANNFRWGRFSPILITPVDNSHFAIIDGQHRTHAARACGIKNVPAMVVEMTDQEAAEAFVWVNSSVTAVTPIQIYKSSLAADLPWALQCRETIESAGCKLMTMNYSGKDKKPGQIYCISLIKKHIEAGNKTVLVKVLKALRKTELHDQYYFSTAIVKPMVDVFVNIKKVSLNDLVDFLENNSLEDIERGVHRIREQPAYFREPHNKLLQKCILAKWNEYKRDKVK